VAKVIIRGLSLFVEVVGRGTPLLLMHGGPGADHWTLHAFRKLSDAHTLVFYDHRCNGRSTGAPVTSMTWENLTADADALRDHFGFERWSVLGHSFGGKVALEYALRYPDRVTRLVLMDTGGDSYWDQQHGPKLLAERGFPAETVELAERYFRGEIPPNAMMRSVLRLGKAYNPYTSLLGLLRSLPVGVRVRMRPEAFIFGFRSLTPGWSVMDRLGEISAPTLVLAGRDDFIFPPEHQEQLAAGIPNAQLRIIDRAGHNPHDEQRAEVMAAVRGFLAAGGPASPDRRAPPRLV
jgi:proline iminopeptidase